MSRASLARRDASEGQLGIQEGFVKIVNAVTRVHQYPPSKKTGEESTPFPCVQLHFARLDPKSLEPIEEDPIPVEFGVGKLEKFRPGNAANRDDEEPEDLGEEVGTEGNCLYTDGGRIWAYSKWMYLSESMEQCGFNPDIMGAGYMPDLIGTVGHVKTITIPKQPGITYKKEAEPTALVFDKIVTFPYEKKGKGGSGSGKGTAATAGKPATPAAGKAAPSKGKTAANAAPEPSGDTDGQEKAVEVFQSVATAKAGETVELSKLRGLVLTATLKAKMPAAVSKQVQEQFKDEGWVSETAEALGYSIDGEEITFPDS